MSAPDEGGEAPAPTAFPADPGCEVAGGNRHPASMLRLPATVENRRCYFRFRLNFYEKYRM